MEPVRKSRPESIILISVFFAILAFCGLFTSATLVGSLVYHFITIPGAFELLHGTGHLLMYQGFCIAPNILEIVGVYQLWKLRTSSMKWLGAAWCLEFCRLVYDYYFKTGTFESAVLGSFGPGVMIVKVVSIALAFLCLVWVRRSLRNGEFGASPSPAIVQDSKVSRPSALVLIIIFIVVKALFEARTYHSVAPISVAGYLLPVLGITAAALMWRLSKFSIWPCVVMAVFSVTSAVRIFVMDPLVQMTVPSSVSHGWIEAARIYARVSCTGLALLDVGIVTYVSRLTKAKVLR